MKCVNVALDHSIARHRLNPAELEELLRAFEDAWHEKSGERLSSAEFYDRYRAGELDSLLALSWASYYEGFRRLCSENVDTCLVEALANAG
jgi:hypothetical protein